MLHKHNLPERQYLYLVGRDAQKDKLLDNLKPDGADRQRQRLIPIAGIGGVGKTALALEVGWHFVNNYDRLPPNERFEAIIWVSAKHRSLGAGGIILEHPTLTHLGDILSAIANVLKSPKIITVLSDEERTEAVLQAIRRVAGRVLLILDNLEALAAAAQQEIYKFLRDLSQNVTLPHKPKVIVTLRHEMPHSGQLGEAIRLAPLEAANERHALIRAACQRHGVHLNDSQHAQASDSVGGLPLAADITIGRFAAADQDTRDSLLSNLSEPARHSEELLNYIFEDTFAGLRAQEPRSYRALLALSIFNRAAGATKQDLAAVLKISENTCATYLAPLLVRNLIHRDTRSNDRSNTHLTYYTMLAITHDRVRDILTQNPTEERRLRSRWIDYYLEYTSLYGGHDHVGDWADSYDYLEDEWPNLKDVFDYCTANDRFDDLAKFWLDGRVGDFADLYHHWSRRLDWLTWLIDNAENDSKRRAELAKAMSSKAWILILTGEVKEAQALLVRAWRLRHELSPAAQCVVVNHIIALRERQDKCDRALFWVRKHEAMVSQLPAPSSSPDLAGERAVEDERRLRHKINGDFFHGMILLRLKQTAEARAIFTVMRRMSQELGYLRARIYAENYLADIAIGEGGEENLATARVYLERALDIATRNNDLRRVACCLSSTAHLYETQGENNRARSRAAPARELFERLGMEAEAGEMAALLQRLDH